MRDRFGKCTNIIRKWLVIITIITAIIMSFLNVLPAMAKTQNNYYSPHLYSLNYDLRDKIAFGEEYLLDKEIKWADGSIERVQLGKDGFFRLNGEKKRLIGMFLSTHLPYGELGQFWLPENLEILDKKLNYLEALGIRLIRIDLRYVRWWLYDIKDEEKAYTTLLDLIYKHKMLLIPGIHAKWIKGFGHSENPDFEWQLPLPEHIINAGFEEMDENRPKQWFTYQQNTEPTFLCTEQDRNGGLCVGIELPESQFKQWPQAIWLQDIPVYPSKTYKIGGWVKTENVEGEGGAMIVAHWKGERNQWLSASKFMSFVKGTNDWKYYNGEVTTPEGATICTLCLMMEGCSGRAWFDEIKFGSGNGVNSDSLGKWAERWSNVVAQYPNIVAVNVENELDYKLLPEDLWWNPNAKKQEYTPEWVDKYMSFLTRIIRNKINIPITHNLMLNREEPEIKEVCLSYVDIPAFDCYASTAKILDADLKSYLPNLNNLQGWWCLELNYGGVENVDGVIKWDINTDKFSGDYIHTVFNHGASIVILFWSSDVIKKNWGFFNEMGEPKPQLAALIKTVAMVQSQITDKPILLARAK